jgi:signal transduction histidine kinase
VIVLDVQLFGPAPMDEQLDDFIAKAPVILFGSPQRQVEFARLLAGDRLDFVGRCGDFIPLVVSLLERRLQSTAIPKAASLSSSLAETAPDLASIFRHEINNPLTGILGNAELVLAHSDGVSSIDKQRLQTVVDLAVRLRETIRRVSNSIENEHSSAQSA